MFLIDHKSAAQSQKSMQLEELKQLYDQDFVLWIERTTEQIRRGEMKNLDWEHLWLFVTLYAKSTYKMPRQHTSNPKIPKVSKAIASSFY